MNGVTIKQEITEREVDRSTLLIVTGGIAIAIVVAFITFVKCLITSQFGYSFLVILAVIAMLGYARTMWKAYENTWLEYIVEVDDSVNINQFLDKYDVVEKEDGNVYRVREAGNLIAKLCGR